MLEQLRMDRRSRLGETVGAPAARSESGRGRALLQQLVGVPRLMGLLLLGCRARLARVRAVAREGPRRLRVTRSSCATERCHHAAGCREGRPREASQSRAVAASTEPRAGRLLGGVAGRADTEVLHCRRRESA
jgi:hypothetical protein